MELALFTAYAFISSVTPGPANVAIFGRASQKGFRSVLPFVIGVVSGFLVVLATSEVLVRWGVELAGPFYLALKIVGSLYLLYLAYRLWREAGAETTPSTSIVTGLGAGFLVHVTSLKAWLFPFIAFTVLVPHENRAITPIAVFWVCAVVSHLLWAWLGGAAHTYLSPRRIKLINQLSAVMLAILVVYTLIS